MGLVPLAQMLLLQAFKEKLFYYHLQPKAAKSNAATRKDQLRAGVIFFASQWESKCRQTVAPD